MFTTIDYLKEGSVIQQKAYHAITSLELMNDLVQYTPVLCGTIPINIHLTNSDLDIIFEVQEDQFSTFEKSVHRLYGHYDHFKVKHMTIRHTPVFKANFHFGGFEFELFAQPISVTKQRAYQHMVVEHALLNLFPELKERIIELKENGYKTEPAFAQALNIQGDPYDELIRIGKEKQFIE
ncbi:DUF4269 domain-containing protein [Evansella halocellulosilytica]|uniref:DUF4269 domain-containing protein n=1 Tax=Evansella halocellulosilytica TaxID=2011013 RepID=UPI000BB7C5B8|nr:DUF4269 domain-containing protein [Evansella halocellulosilytica]